MEDTPISLSKRTIMAYGKQKKYQKRPSLSVIMATGTPLDSGKEFESGGTDTTEQLKIDI